MQWPKQSECDAFYGNPRGRGGAVAAPGWTRDNLIMLVPPFKMAMGPIKISKFPVHRKCRAAFAEWLETVWKNAGRSQKAISVYGMDVFSGSYNYRVMRGGRALSMHAYGCAVDFDAPRNAMTDRTPHFAEVREAVVTPFLKLGGVWGGDWDGDGSSADERRADGMHFQFARMG
jgi:hypothetical protein